MKSTRSTPLTTARNAALVTFLVAAIGVLPAAAQGDRDFVFNDEDGLLVLRFVGAGPELSPSQRDEIVNQEFSQMVHDRLRADLRFDVEPRDSAWALPIKTRLDSYLREQAPEFSTYTVECRSASCRIVLEHTSLLSISEQQDLMSRVQQILLRFIDRESPAFEPVFLMSAFDQGNDLPHIKAFLQRASRQRHAY